jgi:hypothetical protein
MDDHIRVSDADRDRVTARLREHFAEGRLTQDELDERISAALNAKTFGDLRPLMADLPEPVPAPPRPVPHPQWSGPAPWGAYRRGPRLMPLLLLVGLVALLANGGGWMMLGLFQVILVFWLVSCVIAAFAVGGYRRRMSRYWQSGHDHQHRPR